MAQFTNMVAQVVEFQEQPWRRDGFFANSVST